MSRLRTAIAASGLAGALAMLPAIAVMGEESSTPSVSPAPEDTGGAGGDTAAVAINTRDGSDIFRLAFAIKRAMGDVVDNGNAAVAYSSCTDCQTVAISIQVVLMMNDPSVVTPTNLAIAINEVCTLCQSLASAFQVILTTDGPVRFTPDGYREIAAIRRELLEIRDAGLTIEGIVARMDALMDRFFRVLMEEMVDAGPTSAGSPTSAAPSAKDTPSASPDGTSASSPDASVTPDPTSPTPTGSNEVSSTSSP